MFVLLVCLSDLRSDFAALDGSLARQASLVLKKSIKSSYGIEAGQSQIGGVALPEIAHPMVYGVAFTLPCSLICPWGPTRDLSLASSGCR